MRAAWYERNGPAREVLRVDELPDPTPVAGEVRVRIAVSGLNPSDVKRREGFGGQRVEGGRIIPNSDGAGVVDAVGEGVNKGWLGKRVWVWNAQWQRPYGTCAELCCVPEAQVRRLPKRVDFAAGACFGIPAMTAHQAVFSGGAVRGRTVLVTGGAGAVGHYAIQIARWGGAKVIATVSSAEKAKLAVEAGADHVLNYRSENVAAKILELTGGVDRVVEVDFGANLATSIAVLKPNGTIAAYASMSAPEPKLPFYSMMRRGISIDLVFVYLMPSDKRARALADLDAMLTADDLRHNIGAHFALKDVAAAHEAQEAGSTVGNIVIDVATVA